MQWLSSLLVLVNQRWGQSSLKPAVGCLAAWRPQRNPPSSSAAGCPQHRQPKLPGLRKFQAPNPAITISASSFGLKQATEPLRLKNANARGLAPLGLPTGRAPGSSWGCCFRALLSNLSFSLLYAPLLRGGRQPTVCFPGERNLNRKLGLQNLKRASCVKTDPGPEAGWGPKPSTEVLGRESRVWI